MESKHNKPARTIDWSQIPAAIMALMATLFGMIILDVLFFVSIWPDWKELQNERIPQSRYMQDYQATEQISWQALNQNFPRHLTRPFIIAEDSRFYQHPGFDRQAIREAMRINWQQKRWVYGASTISQQTAKNLFLSHDRSLHRKWHEIVMTVAMERHLTKDRILTIYLNIAEFGPGIFGVEAASRYYFGKGFLALSPREAAELAATLPSPRRHNPKTQTRFFQTKRNRIVAVLNLPPESPEAAQQIELILPPDDDFDEAQELPDKVSGAGDDEIISLGDRYYLGIDDPTAIERNQQIEEDLDAESEQSLDETSDGENFEDFDPGSDFD